MSEFEMMSERLGQTGLYNISEDSAVYAELMAYAAGLDLYFDELEKIRSDIFFDIAEGSEPVLYERLMHICNIDKSPEGRKQSIISALTLTDKDFTLDGIKKLMGIYNIEGEVEEQDGNLIISCTNTLSEGQRRAISEDIQRFAPIGTRIDISGGA